MVECCSQGYILCTRCKQCAHLVATAAAMGMQSTLHTFTGKLSALGHLYIHYLAQAQSSTDLNGRHLLVDRDLFKRLGAGARDVMLLQLWAQLFPVSDRRHPVTTPLALLTSSYLALCPVTSCHAAAVGKQHIPSALC